MHLVVTSLALVLALVVPPGGSGSVPLDGATLVLNEFLAGPATDWDGSGAVSTRDDEWVEIYNAGATVVDLSGYLLTDADLVPRYAFSGTLAPGGWRIVYGSDAYAWEKASGQPAYGLSLGNTGDTVMLWQVAGAETVLVDSYAYRTHEAAADRAVGRRADGGEWALFDALDPYTGTTPPLGTGCAPSPAATNLCGDVPALPSSWGRIKSLYK